jgi:hypothetical protein
LFSFQGASEQFDQPDAQLAFLSSSEVHARQLSQALSCTSNLLRWIQLDGFNRGTLAAGVIESFISGWDF